MADVDIEIAVADARSMAESPDNWPPMHVKRVAAALLAAQEALRALIHETWNIDAVRNTPAMEAARNATSAAVRN